ncbi:transglutaminase-like domain-containing protein [Agrococcus jenensis]|uniref:Transglutaminase superfamily protein n=1 Tax=Agrococcus jenensis TaxID=46353 RepID=A0A3N2ATL3_9MICO|nr:transglutaminase-like domain-containing protein [Agrococcus jenensis]ROR66379.1 transglutaminase superfamily protein [Agrococcus jenensis]
MTAPAFTAAPERPATTAAAPRDRRRPRSRAGLVETLALAALPVAWLWSTQSVLGTEWLWPVLLAVVSMGIAAALARAAWSTFAGSAAAAIVGVGWTTALTAADDALIGVIPTPASVEESLRVLTVGVQDVAWAIATPIALEPPVLAVVVVAAAVLAVHVDLIGLALRAPAIAILFAAVPLLLPIAFRVDVPWWHALPGVAASALALAAPSIDERLVLGRPWAGPIGLVAVAALVAVAVPLVAPSPREVDVDLPTLDDLFQPSTPILDASIDLGDELRRPDPRSVFTYATTDGQPTVTRVTTLSQAGPNGFVDVEPQAAEPAVLVEGADAAPLLQMTVRMSDVRAESLPMPERALDVAPPDGAGWDDANDALRVESGVVESGLEYTATGSRSPLLEVLPAGTGSTGHDAWLELPPEAQAIGAQGAALVDEGMSAGGRVLAVHGFMTSGVWNYSEQLDLPGFAGGGGTGWDALAGFLETRAGYCVHYASATATLLRGAGVPSRVVIGFLPGAEIAGGRSVTTNDFHAWAEAWVDGAGWVRVETTPGAGTGVASPEGDETTPSPTPSATSAAPTPTLTPSASPSPSASPGASAAPGQPTAAPGPGIAIDWAAVRGWLIALGVLLLLALPMLVRAAQRALRLRRGAPGAWLELRASLADAGVRLPGSATPGEVQAAIAARAPAGAAAADRVRLAAERAVFDDGPREPGVLDDDVRRGRRALADALPPWRRVLSALLPPSLFRVVPPLHDE